MSDLPSYFELQQMDEIEKLRREVKLMSQLMKEMADAFEKLGVRGCEYFNSSDYPDPYGLHIEHRKDCVRCMSKEVLEKYRKFLEGIEK